MKRWGWMLLFVVACGNEPEMFGTPDEEVCLKNRRGGDYCIDVYEAAREDADANTAGMNDESAAVSLGGRVTRVVLDAALDGAGASCEDIVAPGTGYTSVGFIGCFSAKLYMFGG